MISHCVLLEEAWASWNAFSTVSPVMCTLAEAPSAAILREILPTIERYIVVLYDQGSSEDEVNRARQVFFKQKEGRSRRFHQCMMPSCNNAVDVSGLCELFGNPWCGFWG